MRFGAVMSYSSINKRYGFDRAFHLMPKPIGPVCNIDCTYCYYLHKEQLLADKSTRMPDDILEKYIQAYCESQDVSDIRFSWHGGEPTLLGIPFFRKILEFQKKYANDKRIMNDLQTNGTLLSNEWSEFFKANHFLIGISIDGPRHLHDEYRIGKHGEPTFDKVMEGVHLLQKHQVMFNTLSVVNRLTAKCPEEVYNFLTKEVGSVHLQFLPCVEHKTFCQQAPLYWDKAKLPVMGTPQARPGHPDSVVTEWSVDPDNWGDFLCRIFDLWIEKDLKRIQISWFETLMAQWNDMPPRMCVTAEVCGRALAVERDGSVYACDRFVYPEYQLGNIMQNDLSQMVYSAKQRKFGCNKRDALTDECKKCEFLKLCGGGCPKERMVLSPSGQAFHNYLCPGLKKYFAHVAPYKNRIHLVPRPGFDTTLPLPA